MDVTMLSKKASGLLTAARRNSSGILIISLAGMIGGLGRSARKLRESEERFDLAMRGANDGLWDWNLVTGQVYFSPRWKSMLGYEPPEIRDRFDEWQSRVHPADLDRAMKTIQDHFDGLTAYYELEHRLLHKDGAYRWILARGVTLRDSDGKPVRMAGSHTDITARKRAEEAVGRRDAILRATGFAAERFLEGNTAWEEDIQAVLGQLGLSTGVERVYIWENHTGEDGDLLSSQRFEWVAEGVASEMDNPDLQDLPLEAAGFGRWVSCLGVGELIHGHVREFPQTERQILEAQRIKSIVVVPIFVGTQWWGFIGFDACEVERDWSEPEMEALRAVASTLGAAIGRGRAQERLYEQEEQYQSIFQATSDGIVITQLGGVIVDVNPAICQLLGYSREELLGSRPVALANPDSHKLFLECIAVVKAGKTFQTRMVALHKDGTQFHVEVHASGFTLKGKRHILAVVRDVTEQTQAYQLLESRVEERTRELATLLDVSHNVASTLELQPLLGLILDQLRQLVEYSGAAIHTLEGEELVIVGYRGPIPEDLVLRSQFRFPSVQTNYDVIRREEPIIIPDVRGDTIWARSYQELAGDRLATTFAYVRSWMGVPLVTKTRVIGVMSLAYQEPGHYTERHLQLAMAIASQAAVAIENAKLYEQAQSLAALKERQRLARDLHDSVSQALYGIALGARTARTLLDRDPAQATQPLEYVLSLTEAGLAEMRALIFELRPESLEAEGLVAALSKQAGFLRARHGIAVEVKFCEEPLLSLDTKEALYRIAQEAMHNTIKHARATKVELKMSCEAEQLILEISDDGQGFDPQGDFSGHLGLRSMRERTHQLGGTLEVSAGPGSGARVRAQIPYRPSANLT